MSGRSAESAGRKRPSSPPKLVAYGILEEITGALANKGKLDGGLYGLKTGGAV